MKILIILILCALLLSCAGPQCETDAECYAVHGHAMY